MDYKEKTIKNINIQIIFSSLFILTIIISILISYNEKHFLETNERLISVEDVYNITLINRIIVLLLFIGFVYISWDTYKTDQMANKSTKGDTLEIIAATLSLIPGFIVLYDVLYYFFENESISYESPNV